MITVNISTDSPLKESAELVKRLVSKESFARGRELVLNVSDTVSLQVADTGITSNVFEIDLFADKLLWRLNHSGKNSEAVCRAVIGRLSHPKVFDATAGLGRESIILQNAGAEVTMFERNPVIWLLLLSAVHKAGSQSEIMAALKNGLPRLAPLGSVAENLNRSYDFKNPDVVYYDPMFPKRTKTALVKKEMRIFHELVGYDEDTLDYANYLLTVASHHLVVKRPGGEPPLELNVRRSSFVDGKACRFDCYFVNSGSHTD